MCMLAVGVVGVRSLFQRDAASVHESRLEKSWFAETDVENLERPVQSPDLNPTQHLYVRRT